MSKHGYKILQFIGKGTFGNVYKVYKKSTFAMKKLKVFGLNTYDKSSIINEILILSHHNCSFLLSYHTAFVYLNYIYIITPFASNGDLYKEIKKRNINNKHFKTIHIWKIFIQLCLGIKYLHDHSIIHRDIKTSNIFLENNYTIKIGDFGISKILKNKNMTNTQIGTPLYMSPEILLNKKYNYKIDIWSLGCVLHELLTLKHIVKPYNLNDLYYKINKKIIHLVVPTHIHGLFLSNLTKKLITHNQFKRPSIYNILDMDYIKEKINELKIIDIGNKNNRNIKNIYKKINIPRNLECWKKILYDINNCSFKKPVIKQSTTIPSIIITDTNNDNNDDNNDDNNNYNNNNKSLLPQIKQQKSPLRYNKRKQQRKQQKSPLRYNKKQQQKSPLRYNKKQQQKSPLRYENKRKQKSLLRYENKRKELYSIYGQRNNKQKRYNYYRNRYHDSNLIIKIGSKHETSYKSSFIKLPSIK